MSRVVNTFILFYDNDDAIGRSIYFRLRCY
jgi:hypothetical protein